ncbi:bifunctional glutamate N-acetyltransferase/amino-acid acetyltransferase ArgJ [Hominifimenecus sp. rT4P-3]|uniref:bifunctional glutamate N-acetyltransferase/amino-acid acetyltransferase ArgJ n=1 Tax=Hominifimenecus sp. rT4P-3 TaxID=3242979 RepID=UPI003DA1CB2F
MNILDGGVTAPKGFFAAGIKAGIKKEKKDMAVVFSEIPCESAGVFTRNLVKAAPVKWDKQVVDSGAKCQAVIVNSGIANACTGEEGMQHCAETASEAASVFGIAAEGVFVASTGVIGPQLPMDKLLPGIKQLKEQMADTREAARLAAEAIMTTDTVSKEVAVQTEIGGKTVTVAGMCKGSGMIHPDMCTMLCFLTTDVSISKEMLQKALSSDVEDTFNMISVDGDTSTNDTVLVLANGASGCPTITSDGADYQAFLEAFHYVMEELCKKIAGDGEGATALFEVKVIHAKSKEQAKILSKSVATSNLTKAAIYGHDANWGRILCAMGYSGADFEPEIVDLYFESAAGKLKIVENGTATDYSEEVATKILSEPAVTAIADLKLGEAAATAWGCDLTHEYVSINADYRS